MIRLIRFKSGSFSLYSRRKAQNEQWPPSRLDSDNIPADSAHQLRIIDANRDKPVPFPLVPVSIDEIVDDFRDLFGCPFHRSQKGTPRSGVGQGQTFPIGVLRFVAVESESLVERMRFRTDDVAPDRNLF